MGRGAGGAAGRGGPAASTRRWQQSIKNRLTGENTTVHPDRVIIRNTGEVEVRRGYFYTHGRTPADWAAEVRADLEAAGFNVTVRGADHFATWPNDSYFQAFVREA